jgi:deoxyribonuclease-4
MPGVKARTCPPRPPPAHERAVPARIVRPFGRVRALTPDASVNVGAMGRLRFGPSGLHADLDPETAVATVAAAGYDACEVGFVGGFKGDYELLGRIGAAAREHDVALSVHAPLAAFMGHAELGKKYKMAVGMLDHTAGLAKACGAEVIVFHPGFLLGRERQDALDAVVEQLELLGERLEAKDRLVPFGVEVMGRVRDLGSLDDVLELAARVPFVRPVLDFAHLHATSDGAYTDVEAFAAALEGADDVLDPDAPFHVHFSDIAYANRNETKHLPYGEGTLRAEPLAAALARFERPATVISEAPDEASTQTIGAVLRAGASAASRSS